MDFFRHTGPDLPNITRPADRRDRPRIFCAPPARIPIAKLSLDHFQNVGGANSAGNRKDHAVRAIMGLVEIGQIIPADTGYRLKIAIATASVDMVVPV
ncbi:MAG: hypothetical protein AMJ56_12640 [Anaerolineae bacterium SG8_19]|nr:MAG: hypothetical protein AMJ56_12640 [Anaerolineae bacterium SG8_19]